jgi:hypothetical protein
MALGGGLTTVVLLSFVLAVVLALVDCVTIGSDCAFAAAVAANNNTATRWVSFIIVLLVIIIPGHWCLAFIFKKDW